MKSPPLLSVLHRPVAILSVAFAFVFPSVSLHAGWAEDAIKKECDYIVDCTFGPHARNHDKVDYSDQAYGAINNVRIFQDGANWVIPGESAVAVMGLMEGVKRLRQVNAYSDDFWRYEYVLDDYFFKWVNNGNGLLSGWGDDSGGVAARVYYNVDGGHAGSEAPNAGSTGQMLAACWKYYEYLASTNQQEKADNWLWWSGGFVQRAGDFLNNSYVSSQKMCAARPSIKAWSDLWITDTAWAQVGMAVLKRYQEKGYIPAPNGYTYEGRSNDLKTGLSSMKDGGDWKNFYRYRKHSENYAARYGDLIDQLCFLPYETDSLNVGEAYAYQISDWWTGNMTPNNWDSSTWTYFGTRWKYWFNGSDENNRLTPGPGLQLAKVEWKHYKAGGSWIQRDRAAVRLAFADSKSDLWMGGNGNWEAGVPNGIVDWRHKDNNTTPAWYNRFSDTSAYFINVVLMVCCDINPSYQPRL